MTRTLIGLTLLVLSACGKKSSEEPPPSLYLSPSVIQLGAVPIGEVIDLPVDEVVTEGAHGHEPLFLRLDGIGPRGRGARPIDGTLERDSRIRLYGGSASDRSEVLDVLAGVRAPARGAVGGSASLTLRDREFLVRDRQVLSRETFFDNLRVARPELEEAEAWEALRAVHLASAVAELPDGLATPLIGDGSPLTRGEISRLCLARVFVARPELVVIDEVLDTLELGDEQTEEVLDAVFAEDAPWAVVVSARDDRVISRCMTHLSLTPARPGASRGGAR